MRFVPLQLFPYPGYHNNHRCLHSSALHTKGNRLLRFFYPQNLIEDIDHLLTSVAGLDLQYSSWVVFEALCGLADGFATRLLARLPHPWAHYPDYQPRFAAKSRDTSCLIFGKLPYLTSTAFPKYVFVEEHGDLRSCERVNKYEKRSPSCCIIETCAFL